MKSEKWMVIACCHLFLVFLGASFFTFKSLGFVDQILPIYGTLSGVNRGYSFFTSLLDRRVRVTFELIDSSGNLQSILFPSTKNQEIFLRLDKVVGKLYSAAKNQSEFQRALITSLTEHIFFMHPEAIQITSKIEEFQFASMDRFRDGVIPEWKLISKYKFSTQIQNF